MPARFPIRFTGVNKAMVLLGVVPEHCRVEVDDGELRVRMAWLFHLDVPRAYVRSVGRYEGPGVGLGRPRLAGEVAGERLVVGTRPDRARPSRAAVGSSASPVEVRTLVVSVEDPDGLIGGPYDAPVDAGQGDTASRTLPPLDPDRGQLTVVLVQPAADADQHVVVGLVELRAGLEPNVDRLDGGLDGAVHDVPSRLSAVDAHSGRIAPGYDTYPG